MKISKLYRKLDNRIECRVCIRHCKLLDGQKGFCSNYMNYKNKLVNYGYGVISAVESRPIEIKPLYHFYPGSYATTFSGWGCCFLCPWCQNWHLSKYKPERYKDEIIKPETIVGYTLKHGDDGVCASFNEPTIHMDYICDVFKLAKKYNLYNTIVTNGSYTKEAAEYLIESGLDAANVDVKGCPETYKKFIGIKNLQTILENTRYLKERGVHIEITYLIVTGANDYIECINWVVRKHIEYFGLDTPLHINKYYPQYKYHEDETPIQTLIKAYNIAKKYGIKYVYIGNIRDNKYMNTYCPECNYPLIIRSPYRILKTKLEKDKCLKCGYKINIIGKIMTSKKYLF